MVDRVKFYFGKMRTESFNTNACAVSKQDIELNKNDIKKAYDAVIKNPSKEAKAYFDLVLNPEGLDEIKEYANYVASNFENFVVLGIGGSALGARAIFSALTNMNHKKNKIFRKNRPNWFIRDSINPDKFLSLLEIIDCKKTMFCVVTKSGGTLETLTQLTLVIERLKKELGENYTKNICAITANKDGKLNKWAVQNKVKTFYFSTDVSGRFSVLSAVGLLPAAVVGADIDKILSGAKDMLLSAKNEELLKNPALYGATLQKILMEKGLNISYLMPYADNLKVLSEWYCQLWAESLGKKLDYNGVSKYVGQTPVRALGTVDQHSQLQLCLEGKYDKVMTFIRVTNFHNDAIIPDLKNGLLDDYVANKKLSDILNTSQEATEKAMFERGRVSRTIVVDSVDEYVMGNLMMFFMLETSFTGALLGLNTYNQPSVELIKINIKKMLSEK